MRWLLAGGLVLLSAVCGARQPELVGEWRPAGADAAAWQSFDPQRLTRIPRQPDGAELRLWLAEGTDRPEQPMMLVIRRPALERFALRPDPGDSQPIRASLLSATRDGWQGHGRIGWLLPELPSPARPVELLVEPQPRINGTLAFKVQTPGDFQAEQARWLALVSTCLALLVGMAVIALVFALRLRDATYLLYSGYLLSYTTIQLVQTGFIASPLGWATAAASSHLWGRVAVVGSVVLAALFLRHFASLPGVLPSGDRVLKWFAAAVVVNAALGLLPFAPLQESSRALLNPLLILGGPLLLVLSVMAWRRGSRYAGFFAIGWTPLLLVTAADSLQLYGFWRDWLWTGEAALVAAAFEAVVLSAGLADRAAGMRRDRDIAVALASIDPLTGVLNRGALMQRLQVLLADPDDAPLTMLFCDLDHFKQLNDSQGHAAGDAALRAVTARLAAELRPFDVIGRYGGEEFVLLLPGCDAAQAQAIAERLRAQVEREPIGLTISIGLARHQPDETADALLARADAALYAAKDAGRNRVATAAVAAATPLQAGAALA